MTDQWTYAGVKAEMEARGIKPSPMWGWDPVLGVGQPRWKGPAGYYIITASDTGEAYLWSPDSTTFVVDPPATNAAIVDALVDVFPEDFCPTARPADTFDQPQPAGGTTPVWPLVLSDIDKVRDDMAKRDAVGRERYGQPLMTDDGRDHLADAYQELLDAAVYLRSCTENPDSPVDVARLYDEVLAMCIRTRRLL